MFDQTVVKKTWRNPYHIFYRDIIHLLEWLKLYDGNYFYLSWTMQANWFNFVSSNLSVMMTDQRVLMTWELNSRVCSIAFPSLFWILSRNSSRPSWILDSIDLDPIPKSLMFLREKRLCSTWEGPSPDIIPKVSKKQIHYFESTFFGKKLCIEFQKSTDSL